MNFDVAIVVGFLAITLVVGFISSKNIDSIKKYAIGDYNFNTGTLAATLAATWIGGGFFTVTITNTYSDGLSYIILGICEVIAFFVLSIFVAPRIGIFLGDLSIAESMGKLYGKYAQLTTALVGIARVVGTIAIQFKVCSTILQYFLEINSVFSTWIACVLVITYSALGGIKAVTLTDVIQFITFIIFIPILSLVIWGTIDNPSSVANTISTNPSLNFINLSYMSGMDLYNFIALIILFIIPGLDPAIFQRIIISRDFTQARMSLNIAAFAFLFILILTFWTTILLMSKAPNLAADDIIGYIIDNYTYTGLKGILIAGIMAMLMSTADSYINSSSVLFAHDFCVPLNIDWAKKNELLLSRIAAVVIGVFALIISLSADSLFDIIVIMASFYMPLVTVPLFLAIFGFRTSTKSYLFGILVAFTLTVLAKFIDFGITGPIVTVITIFIVAVSIITFHYLFTQDGGWIKIKKVPLEKNRLEILP